MYVPAPLAGSADSDDGMPALESIVTLTGQPAPLSAPRALHGVRRAELQSRGGPHGHALAAPREEGDAAALARYMEAYAKK